MKIAVPMSENRVPLHELLPLSSPLSLFIDPSDICNFRCKFCFQSMVHHRGSVMELDMFKKIVADMKTFGMPFKMVHLNGFGEPLINPDIVEFVRLLKKEGVAEKVQITTNGYLLTPKLAVALCEAGVDRILFSIYGLTNAEYGAFSVKTEGHDSFDRVFSNIKYLFSLDNRCMIHTKIAGDYFSEEEKREFIEKFGAVSDSIHIDNAINAWPGLTVENTGSQTMYGERITEKICPMPFYQCVIHSNGLVSPCCVDYN